MMSTGGTRSHAPAGDWDIMHPPTHLAPQLCTLLAELVSRLSEPHLREMLADLRLKLDEISRREAGLQAREASLERRSQALRRALEGLPFE